MPRPNLDSAARTEVVNDSSKSAQKKGRRTSPQLSDGPLKEAVNYRSENDSGPTARKCDQPEFRWKFAALQREDQSPAPGDWSPLGRLWAVTSTS